ncbi:unnamed protein product [Moneuplotes crassus]|uniref:Uncharacterized protein n=1 Tax=Euplotes crassus TaxID=5936 RepID=A0AAD2CWK9_EUPCR|nr:unnamed protein product [Moneuplotes crassus]
MCIFNNFLEALSSKAKNIDNYIFTVIIYSKIIIIETEKQISKKERRFEKEIFALVRRDVYNYTIFLSGCASFLLHLNDPSTNRFAKKMKYTAMPELNQLSLNHFPPKKKTTASFVTTNFPRSVEHLVIDQGFILKPIREYFTELIKIVPKVQQKISFRSFTINDREFKRIISAVRHVRRIFFAWCEISVTKVPDFSSALDKTRLEELSMQECSYGYGHKSNWEQNYLQFKNFIEGLGTSHDLKQSLKSLKLKFRMLTIGDIKNILNENGFEEVRLSL